ncbi:hypothetical protein FM107_14975 [Sphingobacterium sp. JB170]|nr:hypothetical protein FM107_14975 [Sphingobacterium sp. JB170]
MHKVQNLEGKESKKNTLLWPLHDASINTNPKITQTEGY